MAKCFFWTPIEHEHAFLAALAVVHKRERADWEKLNMEAFDYVDLTKNNDHAAM